MSNYTRWYRDGSVAVTNGSTSVVGTGTYWNTAGLNAGDMLTLDNGQTFSEVASITDDTHLTLATAYTGTTGTGKGYAIVRNFTAATLPKIAAQTAQLIGDFQRYVDTDLERITGKSAYEIACNNGFSGTEAQWLDTLNAYGVACNNGFVGSVSDWLTSLTAYGRAKDNGYTGSEADWLESLIGAGQWNTLDSRTKLLTNYVDDPFRYHYMDSTDAGLHNSIYRGKFLGNSVTEAQWAAIKSGTFDDLWIGDFWYIKGRWMYIAAFDPVRVYYTSQNAGTHTYDTHFTRSGAPWGCYVQNWNAVTPANGGGSLMLVAPCCNSANDCAQNDNGTFTAVGETERLYMTPEGETTLPYGLCYGRTNENGGLYKLKQYMGNAFGAEHLGWRDVSVCTAFADGAPTAFANEVSWCEVISIASVFGYYPKPVHNYQNAMAYTECFQYPFFRISHHSHWGLTSCREEISLGVFASEDQWCYAPMKVKGPTANYFFGLEFFIR